MARKKILKVSANGSTTNMPPNVSRGVDAISVIVETRVANTPRSDSGIAHHFRRAGKNTSTTATSTMKPDRISSGRIAWKSIGTRSAPEQGQHAPHRVVG